MNFMAKSTFNPDKCIPHNGASLTPRYSMTNLFQKRLALDVYLFSWTSLCPKKTDTLCVPGRTGITFNCSRFKMLNKGPCKNAICAYTACSGGFTTDPTGSLVVKVGDKKCTYNQCCVSDTAILQGVCLVKRQELVSGVHFTSVQNTFSLLL